MKKTVILTLLVLLTLTSCTVKKNTVTFVDGDTTTTDSTSVLGYVIYPTPLGKDNCVFDGWYLDADLTTPVPNNYKPTSDVTLYASYAPDYVTIINSVYTDHIRSNVTILATHYASPFNSFLKTQGQGSGVIVAEDEHYYYCVTNYHVTDSEDGYPYASYTVSDCYGAAYEAKLIDSYSEYDLALLAFRKKTTELRVAEISDTPATVGERVIAIGQPEGLINATTFGVVENIGKVDVAGSADASYQLESIWHTAPMNHGSSGGALYNDDMLLIGINYAVAEGRDGSVTHGFAIPAEKLVEFLQKNELR